MGGCSIELPSEEYGNAFYTKLCKSLRRRGATAVDCEVEIFDMHEILEVWGQIRLKGKVFDFAWKKGRLKLTPYKDYTLQVLRKMKSTGELPPSFEKILKQYENKLK